MRDAPGVAHSSSHPDASTPAGTPVGVSPPAARQPAGRRCGSMRYPLAAIASSPVGSTSEPAGAGSSSTGTGPSDVRSIGPGPMRGSDDAGIVATGGNGIDVRPAASPSRSPAHGAATTTPSAVTTASATNAAIVVRFDEPSLSTGATASVASRRANPSPGGRSSARVQRRCGAGELSNRSVRGATNSIRGASSEGSRARSSNRPTPASLPPWRARRDVVADPRSRATAPQPGRRYRTPGS